jgi:hypothetical protein
MFRRTGMCSATSGARGWCGAVDLVLRLAMDRARPLVSALLPLMVVNVFSGADRGPLTVGTARAAVVGPDLAPTSAVAPAPAPNASAGLDESPAGSPGANPVAGARTGSSAGRPDASPAAVRPDEAGSPFYLLIAPPTDVRAVDHPNDNGGTIDISWQLSPNDTPADNFVTGYVIRRALDVLGPYEVVGRTAARTTRYVDSSAGIGVTFFYKVDAEAGEVQSQSEPVGPVVSTFQWVNWSRWNLLLLSLTTSLIVLWWVNALQRGRRVQVRRIPALEAVGEAVGRATEMGRPILFVPGLQDMDDMQTVAALTVLGRVSRTVAEYDATIEVPTTRSLVMAAARDTLQRAYYAAGRPDSFKPDAVYYVTNEQFGYVAAINGVICREEPATCLYFGAFYAESLILAETGRSVGAVQIAGTAETPQIPFFLAACDYVLIGEEFYAASAYLSGDPRQLGSLKGQDVGKVIAGAAIALGSVLATVAAIAHAKWATTLAEAATALFRSR